MYNNLKERYNSIMKVYEENKSFIIEQKLEARKYQQNIVNKEKAI